MGVTKLLLSVVATAALTIQALHAQPFHLGSPVDDFTLRDPDGRSVSYSALKGNVIVVVFISTRCPMSNAHNHRLNVLYNQFGGRVKFLVVNSNSNESPAEVREYARTVGFDFPVYKDVNNVVADLFDAQATPDTFVIDSSGRMRYHGYIDDSPNPARVNNPGLRLAIEAVLTGKSVLLPETKTFGCSIKRARN
jgi:peroxiredoxin